MLRLQKIGCHNINFVSPTHFLPNIVQALVIAAEAGLNVPIVYNTGTYDHVETLQQLDGIIDIYLPDYKYSDGKIAARYSPGTADYPEIAKSAIKEMYRQVGLIQTDDHGIAQRGLMIRHLILPDNRAGTEDFTKFVTQELNPGVYVNIMAQYHPSFKAHQFPELARPLTPREYRQALDIARQNGLTNLDE